MKKLTTRRNFLGTLAASTILAEPVLNAAANAAASGAALPRIKTPLVLRPFFYQGVSLGPSRWQKQFESARDYYLAVPEDNILHGFRRAAGINAPGHALGGWAERDSSVIFGQWLQAMARTARAQNDTAMRDKAVKLVEGWAKTLGSDGNPRMRHYPWEKLVGGLSDMAQYAGYTDALKPLERVVDWAIPNLDRARIPAARSPWELHSGQVLEWYTLAENLYRAYLLTGSAKYRDFAVVWHYPAYWDKFASTSSPTDAHGVHAYSHCNTFSSAAMACLVGGDASLLQKTKNFYDYLQNTQCFATGGYGPAERYVLADGALGQSLEIRLDSCEAPCCSWAAFKLAKHLITLTGEARYGDWIERMLYNAIGASLPIVDNGRHFYYASYHLGSAMKVYSRTPYTCCTGTYFQDVVEYQDLIYFQGDDTLCVNLYLPSSVAWKHDGQNVKLTQETAYPEAETITLKLRLEQPARFGLRLRIPSWAGQRATCKVNGAPAGVPLTPGQWATLERDWQNGDRVELSLPLHFRRSPVDAQHPNRIAIVRGPVVYAQEVVHKHLVQPPQNDDDLNDWLVGTDDPAVFRYKGQEQSTQRDDFMPFYRYPELASYRMYFDPGLRSELW